MELVNIGPETEQREYKKSIGELKEGMLSIASILNKHGSGELWFGVKNDGTVIGQEIGEDTIRTVSQAVQIRIRPAVYPEICEKMIGDRSVVLVKFQGKRQPYLAYNVPRIRVGDEDLVMDQDTYDELLRERDDKRKSWESQTSGYTVEDVDEMSLERYLKKAKEAGRITFDTEDTEIVLKKLGLMSGKYLLNAGAALFCDTGMNELQIAKFASNEKLTFTDIRMYTGSIIDLADRAERYVVDAMDWRAEIRGFSRVEIPEVPVEAIREAIVNSLVHRVVEAGQSNQVLIFKNRIEIYNYGAFPEQISPEQFIEGNEMPIRRNPLIAKTLYYSKHMENFATGLKRIHDLCTEAGCKVEFQKKAYGFSVIFYRHGQGVQESASKEDSEVRDNAGKESSGVRDDAREEDFGVRDNAGKESSGVRDDARGEGFEVRGNVSKEDSGVRDDAREENYSARASANKERTGTYGTVSKAKTGLRRGQNRTDIEIQKMRNMASGERVENADEICGKMLSEQEQAILDYVREAGEITAREAEELLNVKRRRVNDVIKKMMEMGLLKKEGTAKYVKYVPL